MTLVPGQRVVAHAPVRVADVGGWTDTWFGSPGQVCSVAVGPAVEVAATVVERPPAQAAPVRLRAPDLEVDCEVGPSDDGGWTSPAPGEHPLLEHAIAAVVGPAELPDDLALDVEVRAAVPPGASLGTSSSVVVALLGALDHLLVADGHPRSASDIARLAHWVETVAAGREAGVQDQWAAAMGGCGRYVVGPYPEVHHHGVHLPAGMAEVLAERLVTVVIGAHDSSAVHHEVIHLLTACGGPEHDRARDALRRMASLAADAADALHHGHVHRWAEVLTEATAQQEQLLPALVGASHHLAIELGRSVGALGWKVNGAGGDGGSVTFVAGEGAGDADALRDALASADQGWTVVDLRPSDGLRVSVA